ncbi:restriction endonuclease subunit S [Aliirhizobium terrae]|uniref:restriction endonuclease subunit S n=1 Tax=Terrirhizobium terrae TaxID=2926709 RepID=UPI002574AAA6|nr:restriction endonuclease subunit S [Rhizobium sp. CC-CFT758]WJH42121.1 restriction endonuclease subunit S [Rhizobium sp. CC-CFT758]
MTEVITTENSHLSALPLGWSYASIEELAGPDGIVSDGDWVESKNQDANGTVRLIQLADIGDGQFVGKSKRFMSLDVAQELGCTFLASGDVLIARMPNPLGRACILPQLEQAAVTVVDVLVWRPGEKLNGAVPRWLMYAVNSPPIRDAIGRQAGGTTRQRIAGRNLKQIMLPTPPLEEQRRIVAKLDRLFDGILRARAAIDQLPRMLEEYCSHILETGCSGQLTAKWRQENRTNLGAQVRLSDVAQQFDYGTSAKSQPDGIVPVLRMGNIQNGLLDWSDLVFTSDKQEISKYELRDGDVLFNRTNSPELVGKTAVYRGTRQAIFAGYIIRVRCGDRIIPEYLAYCLNAPQGRRYARKVKSDGVSQSNINAAKLAAFNLLLPSLEEQREVVRLIDAAFEWARKVTCEYGSASELISAFESSILSRALRGELLPQDASEEPISDVLGRIQTARSVIEKRSPPPPAKKRATTMNPIDKLQEDLKTWPEDGITFAELHERLAVPYDAMRDIIFECLMQPDASLAQVFDRDSAQMRLVRLSGK